MDLKKSKNLKIIQKNFSKSALTLQVPNIDRKLKKSNSTASTTKDSKCSKLKRGKQAQDEKKVFQPKKFTKKIKRRRKRTRRNDSLYFGPQVECKLVDGRKSEII